MTEKLKVCDGWFVVHWASIGLPATDENYQYVNGGVATS